MKKFIATIALLGIIPMAHAEPLKIQVPNSYQIWGHTKRVIEASGLQKGAIYECRHISGYGKLFTIIDYTGTYGARMSIPKNLDHDFYLFGPTSAQTGSVYFKLYNRNLPLMRDHIGIVCNKT